MPKRLFPHPIKRLRKIPEPPISDKRIMTSPQTMGSLGDIAKTYNHTKGMYCKKRAFSCTAE
jgi:hypothetical protein